MAIKFKHVDNDKKTNAKYAPAKRHLPKWQWYLLGALLFSPMAYFIVRVSLENIIVSAPGYLLFNSVNIRSPENGYIRSIKVSEGNRVKKHEILAKFASPEVDQTIVYLQKEIRILETLKLLDHNYELVKLNEAVETAEKYLQESLHYYEKFKELRKIGIITILQLNTAMKDLQAAKSQVNEIQRQIAISHKRHMNYLEENYNTKIRLLESDLSKTLAIQHRFTLRSPVNGTITYIPTHTDEQVEKGQALMHINDHDELRIKAFLAPKHITEARQGQVVTIVLPNKTKLEGTIMNVPHFARVEPGASKIIKSGSNKIELIIKPNTKIEAPYRVHNIPVKVIL